MKSKYYLFLLLIYIVIFFFNLECKIIEINNNCLIFVNIELFNLER